MLTALLLSVVAPLVAATVLVTIGHELWRRDRSADGGRWSRTIVPVVGAFFAIWALKSIPALPPGDASQWALWFSVVAAGYALLEGAFPIPLPARIGVRVGLSFLTVFHVLYPVIHEELGKAALWTILGGSVIAATWTAIERRAADLAGPTLPLSLMLVGVGAAGTLAASGTALLGQEVGGATATLGVLMVLGYLRSEASWSSTLAGPVSILFGGLLLAGIHYAEVPIAAALLIAAGAATLAAPPLQSLRGLRAAVVHAVLAAVVAFGGLGIAAVAGAPVEVTGEESDDDYGYD